MSRKQRRLPILDRKPDSVLRQRGHRTEADHRRQVGQPLPQCRGAGRPRAHPGHRLRRRRLRPLVAAEAPDHRGHGGQDRRRRAVRHGQAHRCGRTACWSPPPPPGNVATGAVASATHDIFDDLNAALMLLETDGYEPDAWLLRQTMRGVLRNARDGSRGFLYPAAGPVQLRRRRAGAGRARCGTSRPRSARWACPASPPAPPTPWPSPSTPRMFKIAIRDDINMRVFDQGVDLGRGGGRAAQPHAAGQQGFKGYLSLAWVAANPVTLQAPTRTASYPASVLTQGTFVGALGADQALFEEQKALAGNGRPALGGDRETAEDEAGRARTGTRTTAGR